MREHRRQTKEMFVPLTHPPGQAQCDFGEALVVIGAVQRKARCFVLDLPHSDGCFVKAYPAETTEAFLDGHLSAFAFLGGVLQSILYDNTRLAVAKSLAHCASLACRRVMESGMGRRGKREYVQVLRLLESFSQQEVAAAVKDALRLGTSSFDAVKHLVLCRLEGRPPRLDLELYPYLPRVRVSTTSTWDYMTLLSRRAA